MSISTWYVGPVADTFNGTPSKYFRDDEVAKVEMPRSPRALSYLRREDSRPRWIHATEYSPILSFPSARWIHLNPINRQTRTCVAVVICFQLPHPTMCKLIHHQYCTKLDMIDRVPLDDEFVGCSGWPKLLSDAQTGNEKAKLQLKNHIDRTFSISRTFDSCLVVGHLKINRCG